MRSRPMGARWPSPQLRYLSHLSVFNRLKCLYYRGPTLCSSLLAQSSHLSLLAGDDIESLENLDENSEPCVLNMGDD